VRQRRGKFAEDIAAAWLLANNWCILARNVKLGRDEIDIVAIAPNEPNELVCVEVRSARSAHFGVPEERVDRRKVANLYRAARSLAGSGDVLQLGLGRLTVRVDLVVIDLRGERVAVRHLRRLEPV
jgi:putative endonuclease